MTTANTKHEDNDLQDEALFAESDLVKPTPAPWPRKVSGEKLIADMVAGIQKHVIMDDDQALAAALWILQAHTLDAFRISPLLALPSPTKRCGKTTTLSVVSYMVPRPMATARITPAAVYRAVDESAPTLIVGEADTFIHTGSSLRGILNSGHTRDTAYTVVTEKGRARKFRTWCPKVVAAIGSLPDTIEDRAIVIPMRRKARHEHVEPIRVDTETQFTEICRKAVRWSGDNLQGLLRANPQLPRELHDRAADNWLPLLAVAEQISKRLATRARRAAVKMAGADPTQNMEIGELLVQDLQEIFADTGANFLESAQLATVLGEMEHRPYAEMNGGRPITKAKVASILKPFGVNPELVRRGKRVARGYRIEALQDAFARYAA